MIKLENICVIVVLYNDDISSSKAIKSLRDHTVGIDPSRIFLMIYDNSPIKQFVDIESDLMSIEYNHDPSNPGVSKAYNYAARRAKEKGYDFILLLDSDTRLDGGFIDAFATARKKFPDEKIFAPKVRCNRDGSLVSPLKFKNFRGSSLNDKNGLCGILPLDMYSVINSGIFIDVNLLLENGGYDERIKLDFSDHEFLWRVSKVYNHVYLLDAYIDQDLSSKGKQSLPSALYRFGCFLEGGRVFSKKKNSRLYFEIYALLRSMLLSCRFLSPRFIFSYIKTGLSYE